MAKLTRKQMIVRIVAILIAFSMLATVLMQFL